MSQPDVTSSAGRESGPTDDPGRLLIMALLYVVESADRIFVASQTGLGWAATAGPLGDLQAAGYVVPLPGRQRRLPPMLQLADSGRQTVRQALRVDNGC